MDQRLKFALEALQPQTNMTELCRAYGISKTTGYKWKRRFESDGAGGLEDLSRKPQSSPGELSEHVVCKLVKLKVAHPHWGPYKIRALYVQLNGEKGAPSDSSVKRVLERAGLVKKRRRRKASQTGAWQNDTAAKGCNKLWTADFKGWWQTRDGQRCEPLTIRDSWSRYVLEARAMSTTRTEAVRACFEEAFKSYGIPDAIRVDNGPPFASPQALLGLSRLSAWWLALGISLVRGRPGKPQDNGAHERMHRDMALELESCAKGNQREQQAALDLWRKDFNEVRPHQALGMKRPADLYEKSQQKWTGTPADITYPDMITRRVQCDGTIKIQGTPIIVSAVLRGWSVGLKPIDEQRLEVYFAQLPIGEIDLSTAAFLGAARGPQEASAPAQSA